MPHTLVHLFGAVCVAVGLALLKHSIQTRLDSTNNSDLAEVGLSRGARAAPTPRDIQLTYYGD